MRAVRSLIGLGVVLCFGLSACNSDTSGNQDGGCSPRLSYVTPQEQAILPGGVATLTVHLDDCSQVPLAGATVHYKMIGQSKGSQLSAESAVTDASGNATVTLTGSQEETEFEVEVTSNRANSLVFAILVSLTAPGEIMVNMTYGGAHAFNEFQATLYQNKTCNDLPPFALPTALQSAASVSAISSHPSFSNVAPGSGYAVIVRAKLNGKVLGYGCTPALTVNAGQITTADVTIRDLPVMFNGQYGIDSSLDFSGNLPPSVKTVVDVLYELADDREADCKGTYCTPASPNRCGCDPAAFAFDFVARLLCSWRCDFGQSSTDCRWYSLDPADPTQTHWWGHHYGDLEDAYTHTLSGWAPVQSPPAQGAINGQIAGYTIPMACGIVDTSLGKTGSVFNAQAYLQQYYNEYVPTQVSMILNILSDVAGAVNHMHIKSTMTLNKVSADAPGQFTHVLNKMVLNITGLGTIEVDLIQAGLTGLTQTGTASVVNDKLTIPDHTYNLAFGQLIYYTYSHFLLPAILGKPLGTPCTTAELLALIIDPNTVGQWLADTTGILDAQTWASIVQSGLTLGGTALDNYLKSSISTVATIHLAGSASPDQVDDQRVAQLLVNGVWPLNVPPTQTGCYWVEGQSSKPFSGTWNAVRLPNIP